MGGFWGQIRSYFLIFIRGREMATLKINGLSKAFGINTVFENVTFDVNQEKESDLSALTGQERPPF